MECRNDYTRRIWENLTMNYINLEISKTKYKQKNKWGTLSCRTYAYRSQAEWVPFVSKHSVQQLIHTIQMSRHAYKHSLTAKTHWWLIAHTPLWHGSGHTFDKYLCAVSPATHAQDWLGSTQPGLSKFSGLLYSFGVKLNRCSQGLCIREELQLI